MTQIQLDPKVSERIKRAMELIFGDTYTFVRKVTETGAVQYKIFKDKKPAYTVDLERSFCSCRDYQKREITCKHIYAVEMLEARHRRLAV